MQLTERSLLDFLRETLVAEDVGAESALFSSGLLDSVSMVNLIMFIEQSLGIAVSTEDVTLENFDTPSRIMRFAEAVS